MKIFNIHCFVQFGKTFDLDIEASSKKAALNKLEKVIENIGYEYCKGDELIIDVDDCNEVKNEFERF